VQTVGPPRARRQPVQGAPTVGRSHLTCLRRHSLHALRAAEAGVPALVAVVAGVFAAEVMAEVAAEEPELAVVV
jgi:hypothetical protein